MLFEYLLTDPTAPVVGVDGGALRTFQRRVTQWRRLHGPAKEVCFAQVREPGHSLQFDWTHAAELGITLAGVAYPHLLAHAVLPYSNWEWAVPCQSESVLSLSVASASVRNSAARACYDGGDDHDRIYDNGATLRAGGPGHARPAVLDVAREPRAGAAHSGGAVAGGDRRGAGPRDQSHGGGAQT